MGYRIKKSLGFGLTGILLNEDGVFTDPRINTEKTESAANQPVENYRDFLLDKFGDNDSTLKLTEGFWKIPYVLGTDLEHNDLPEVKKALASSPKPRTYNFVHILDNQEQDDESDNPVGTLLIQPFTHQAAWSHHDDAIDYALQQQYEVGMVTSVRTLSYAPAPYNDFFVDYLTLEPIIQPQLWHQAKKLHHHNQDLNAVEAISKFYGYENMQEANERIRPEVPSQVKHIAEWLNIFTDPTTVNTMQPMIISYWE